MSVVLRCYSKNLFAQSLYASVKPTIKDPVSVTALPVLKRFSSTINNSTHKKKVDESEKRLLNILLDEKLDPQERIEAARYLTLAKKQRVTVFNTLEKLLSENLDIETKKEMRSIQNRNRILNQKKPIVEYYPSHLKRSAPKKDE